MSNLLSAQFKRLFRSKLFYICIIGFIAFALVLNIENCFYVLRDYDWISTMSIETLVENVQSRTIMGPQVFRLDFVQVKINFDDMLKNFSTIYFDTDYYLKVTFNAYGVISAILITLLIGAEYSYGTIRNKLIAGHSRTSVYLSNLIVCIAAQVIMQVIYIIASLLPLLIVVVRYMGVGKHFEFTFSFGQNFVYQIIGFGIICVYASIFLLIAMNVDSRSSSAAAALVTAAFMLLLSMYIGQVLYSGGESQYIDYDPYTETVDNAPKTWDNNMYNYTIFEDLSYDAYLEQYRGEGLGSIQKFVFCNLDDILPVSQSNYLTNSSSIPKRTAKYLVSDIVLTVLISGVGIYLFNKKDLK